MAKKGKKDNFVLQGILAFLGSILLIFVIYFISVCIRFYNDNNNNISSRKEKEIEKLTEEYLQNKYGDTSNDFKIVSISKKYRENGFVSTGELKSYYISLIYKPEGVITETNFLVTVDVDSSGNLLTDTFDDGFDNLHKTIFETP